MSRAPEVQIGVARYTVVCAPDVLEHMSEDDARALLARMLETSPHARFEIERQAQELDFLYAGGLREAITVVARAIAEGRIVPVRLRSEPEQLDEPAAVDLRDLVVDDEHQTIRGGASDEDPVPSIPTTWVSFEVVDETGQPADGRFRLAIDASMESGEIERRGHRRDPVREGASVCTLAQEVLQKCFPSARFLGARATMPQLAGRWIWPTFRETLIEAGTRLLLDNDQDLDLLARAWDRSCIKMTHHEAIRIMKMKPFMNQRYLIKSVGLGYAEGDRVFLLSDATGRRDESGVTDATNKCERKANDRAILVPPKGFESTEL